MRSLSRCFARSSSFFRLALRPFPPRLMKYVSMRIPDDGPFGETFFDASARAISGALFVKRPFCGCVESVDTCFTQRRDEPAAWLFVLEVDRVRDFAGDVFADRVPDRFFAVLFFFVGMVLSAS